MALKFRCSNCGEVVIVRYLKQGETAECKACGNREPVPDCAEEATEVELAESTAAADPRIEADPEDLKYVGDPFNDRARRYLAPLWKRLLGYVLDRLIFAVPGFIMLLPAIKRLADDGAGEAALRMLLPFMPEFWIVQLLYLGVLLIQAVLLVERGQTIGKMILRTRIVTLQDKHPAWYRLLIVRPVLPVVATYRPDLIWPGEAWSMVVRYCLSALLLIDALAIFGSERRTVHDRLAGTRVIDIGLLRKAPGGGRISADLKGRS
ncbi:MAG: RDD family protein [bacterium]|jgi:uncharacterized RDD family membrane protein YckC